MTDFFSVDREKKTPTIFVGSNRVDETSILELAYFVSYKRLISTVGDKMLVSTVARRCCTALLHCAVALVGGNGFISLLPV